MLDRPDSTDTLVKTTLEWLDTLDMLDMPDRVDMLDKSDMLEMFAYMVWCQNCSNFPYKYPV